MFKNKLLAIGLAALAGIAVANVYMANQTNNMHNNLSLDNLEAIGQEPSEPKGDRNYLTGPRDREAVTITTVYYNDNTSEQQREIKGKEGRVSIGSGNVGGSAGGGTGSSSSSSSNRQVVYTKTDNVYGCYCRCENDNYCTDYIP